MDLHVATQELAGELQLLTGLSGAPVTADVIASWQEQAQGHAAGRACLSKREEAAECHDQIEALKKSIEALSMDPWTRAQPPAKALQRQHAAAVKRYQPIKGFLDKPPDEKLRLNYQRARCNNLRAELSVAESTKEFLKDLFRRHRNSRFLATAKSLEKNRKLIESFGRDISEIKGKIAAYPENAKQGEVVTKGKPAVPLDTKTRVVYLFNRVVRCIEELVAQAGEFDAFRCGCEEATKALQQAARGLRNLGGPANHGRSSVLLGLAERYVGLLQNAGYPAKTPEGGLVNARKRELKVLATEAAAVLQSFVTSPSGDMPLFEGGV